MDGVGQTGIDWTRWSPFRESEKEEDSPIRLDILSLRNSAKQMRAEPFNEDLTSKVQILWQIGCDVLSRYKYGGQCIEMMGMLAYLNSVRLPFNVFESEENRNLILMLKDVGFVNIITPSPTISFTSTEFPALMDEIRQKNFPNGPKLLKTLIVLINDGRHRCSGLYDAMSTIWQHALTHGIEFIQANKFLWADYLNGLLQHHYQMTTQQKQILSTAVDMFDVEYGKRRSKTIKLKLIQLRLFLLDDDVEIFLILSKNYRSVLDSIFMTTPESLEYLWFETFHHRLNPEYPRIRHLADLIYKRASQMDDLNSRTLLLEEALAYCILGNNVWRSSIPDNDGDAFFSWTLKCLSHLGRTDQMVSFVKEIKEILMDHGFPLAKPWFPDTILQFKGVGKEIINNELSLLLNHFYNDCTLEPSVEEYLFKCLLKCETNLKNWDKILALMREKRGGINLAKVLDCVDLELLMLDLVKNSKNNLEVDELVNESLRRNKQLVKFYLNNDAYGVKYLVNSSPISRFEYDPLVFVIRTCLLMRRHKELLSYMLEYEKLLENKYGDRVGPITNGILLFGEWFRVALEFQKNIGEKFIALLKGVRAITQRRISIISDHPTEIKSWMEGYADLISSDCDSYLARV